MIWYLKITCFIWFLIDKWLFSSTREFLCKRERRTTWTLFLVCFCYFFFVLPLPAHLILQDLDIFNPNIISYIRLGTLCLYWCQYSANFFIYAARSDQFRKAYIYFLKNVSIVNQPSIDYSPLNCSIFTNYSNFQYTFIL